MSDAPLAVIGAGVVGLAVAARLAPSCPGLVLLERHPRHGQETSSRNSEVIHAGLYYPAGSLKAQLCVAGNHALYELCERAALPHRRCGKLIVATARAELPALERLCALGRESGAPLALLTGAQARELEPNVPALAALHSPSTGVISAHALMDHLLHQALHAGALFQPRARLLAVERQADGSYRLTLDEAGTQESFSVERVVNAAGLEADTVAALCGIDVDAAGYRLHWCKGSYFAVRPGKASLVSRLVYPVPEKASLGVHAVIDVGGGLKFGPDAEYLEQRVLDYRVEDRKRAAFAASVRKLLPDIEDADLSPDLSGIRPKLQGPGEGFRDFVIREESGRGLPGLVNLVGIDSPGLTSATAIAEQVVGLLE